ncbi:MAG TPA: M67 family metallopeptidase [Thermoplasmata archaeon]|nr:M67 family metallopeptidase [Thermoplasmata archaeon]
MELRIPATVLQEIRTHARETAPVECCGFLIGSKEGDARIVRAARRATNVDSDATARYQVDSREVLAVEREFRSGDDQWIGIYHSHPAGDEAPSMYDEAHAWPWYIYLIVAPDSRSPGRVAAWILDEGSRKFRSIALRIG